MLKDRTQETTTTSGTGDVSLNGAKARHLTFAANYVIGDLIPYCIESQSAGEWEVGFGRLISSNVFRRMAVTASSNSGELVNFGTGTKNVSVVLNAAKFNSLLALGTPHAASKWFGVSLNNYTVGQPVANASAYTATYGLTMVAEAPFYAVQLVYLNNVNNALSGIKAVVGVTETIVMASTTNAKPVIGGTTYGQLAPAGSVNGFRAVTWNGQATLSLPASTTTLQVGVSDIIPISSVPRADVPGALPAFVLRLYHDPATGGRFPFVASPVGMRTPNAANRGRVVIATNSGFDGVAAPNTNLGAATEMHMVFPIFHYAVPSRTVMIAGDSTEQNDSLVADIYTSWGWRGCADASTPQRPINYMNMGASSMSSAVYWARAQEVINAGVIPDVLVIGPASVNDGYVQANLERTFSEHRGRALDILRFARAKGVGRVVFIPLLPYNENSAAQDAYRVTFNAWLRTLDVPVLEFPELGNGASPERWVPGYNQNADGVHPNEAAIDTIMAPRLTRMLLQIG